jgi:hypothetical protein
VGKMLSPEEFSVGTLASATPVSLILPRSKYEEMVLIGHIDGSPAAVVLSGQFQFRFFPSAGNHNWQGLIIPNIRIEVDEESLFDADNGIALGAAVRTDTRLIVRAKGERSLGQTTAITLHDKLETAGEHRAGFTRWQIVVGRGQDKRILHTVNLSAVGRE